MFIFLGMGGVNASDQILAILSISEKNGLSRSGEYIEYPLQISPESHITSIPNLIIEDHQNGEIITCQISDYKILDDRQKVFLRIIFPVTIEANQTKEFLLKITDESTPVETDLNIKGEGFDLVIENNFFRADLSKDVSVEPQSHDSGQIRVLLIKMGIDQLLKNVEDRLHWAPNFKRPELEYYTTIAHWDSPAVYDLQKGSYRIQTTRQDLAPDHPEISLTAVYQFYMDLPYFKFYSEMQMVKDVWLELLRNDEMTMDSMFTHLAFQRPCGEIVDVAFSEREGLLQNQPIENKSPWICFYNRNKGFAFGSIRLRYNISNQFGEPSPTYQPHTQIGEWLGGIKYWNRRLIHDHLTFVPRGSRYIEENAYLVFRIGQKDRFETIKYWVDRLHHPLKVKVQYQ
jgi:hypothetical protein